MSFSIHGHHKQGQVPHGQDDGHPTTPVEGTQTCLFCKATFSSEVGLRHHKKEMTANESKQDGASGKKLKHIYCHICDKDFISFSAGHQHWIQNHSELQSINCPGCDAHFAKYSGFIKHIECNECPKITQENAAARCKKSIEFAKALGAIDAQRPELATAKGPKDFGPYLGGDSEPTKPMSWGPDLTSPWGTRDFGGWGSSGTKPPNERNFPTMARPAHRPESNKAFGIRNEDPNSQSQQQQKTNAWASTSASAKKLFPNAAPAQLPTQEQLDRLRAQQTAAVERARADHTDPDHPNSPYFSAERYWNVYTKKYKCPRGGCKKTFVVKGALIQHLRSLTHTFGKVYTCPNCLDRFSTLFSLAAHCESASHKCHIRDGDMYERFLSQLTWNLVEVAGEHEKDGTLKYDISISAKVDYGIEKDERPTFGHQQVYGAGSVAKAAAPSNSGSQHCLTMEALAQHQQQQRRQETNTAGHQSVQRAKPMRKECKSTGGGSMALTAEALAKLNFQESQKSASAEQRDKHARNHGQAGWDHNDNAGIEEANEAVW